MYAGSALCFAQHFSLCSWAVPRDGLPSLQLIADLQPQDTIPGTAQVSVLGMAVQQCLPGPTAQRSAVSAGSPWAGQALLLP